MKHAQKAQNPGYSWLCLYTKSKRNAPWRYDRALYQRGNAFAHVFRRLKRNRRNFTRYDKLDIIFKFKAVIVLALSVDATGLCEQTVDTFFAVAVSFSSPSLTSTIGENIEHTLR